jgi:hypothetical protein
VNTLSLSLFPRGRSIIVVQNHHIQGTGGKTAVFVRESLMLETRVSRNLVNIVNSVYSLKEYCPSLSVFLDEQYHLCAESPLSSECEKH